MKLQGQICYPRANAIDPIWESQQKRRESREAYQQRQIREASDQFQTSSESDMDIDNGARQGTSYDEDFIPGDLDEEAQQTSKKQKIFLMNERENDPFPPQCRHVRDSERNVKECIYLALTDLIGIGLSVREALQAVQIVSNRVFDRNFILSEDEVSSDAFDSDMLPQKRSILNVADKVEAHGLAAETNEIIMKSQVGEVITHSSDSTTKKGVNVSGIHINKEIVLPFPTIPVADESREEIAEQAALGFQILAAASGKDPGDLYKMTLMTDSTGHNKFLSEDVPKLFNLDHKVGQIFCCTHTNLGFCRCMNSCISVIENKIGIKNILAGFLVHMDLDSKNGSLAGQFVDCVTTLVGLDMKHKPWNRGKDFKHFCKSNDTNYEMFIYKDERFGCFPKAASVVLYSRASLNQLLSTHPDIDNRLACIVRDIYRQVYLVLVLAVVSAFGMQLVETFHAKTLSHESNHNTLRVLFKELHDKMNENLTEEFFLLESPWFSGISQSLYDEFLFNYKPRIVLSVKSAFGENMESAIKLGNFMIPQLQETLVRQRSDYRLSEKLETEFPIIE